ncbi:hypothetical protein BD324DRAFT_670520 [Kockovaella imperatae]|uniref:Uncharacterized protein n=1 Tax=Kockovaella imperatae TaxID=4999 RepID=A0A1Y1UKX0_9TREE|nr:hypothetical protein BD324DRAFT_670520 [Kockovaella imperatae]ORX38154.1 hypothetical protein BD324DRAFT_670520 [Kockovaella imperatae]
MTVRSVLWQVLSSRTKVTHRPAQPFPFPSKYHIGIICLGFSSLFLFVLWAVTVISPVFLDVPNRSWFSKFAPDKAHAPKNSSSADFPCQPVNFTVGSTLQTQQGIFQYSLLGRNSDFPSSDDTTFQYRGDGLDFCYLTEAALHLDTRSMELRMEGVVFCSSYGLPVILGTEYTASLDPVNLIDSILRFSKTDNKASATAGLVGTISNALDELSSDVLNRTAALFHADENSPRTYSIGIAIETPRNVSCSPDSDDRNQTTCLHWRQENPWNQLSSIFEIYVTYENANTSTSQDGVSNPTLLTYVPSNALNVTISNFFNGFYSAVKVDLDDESENNIFLNKNAFAQQIITVDNLVRDPKLNITLVGAVDLIEDIDTYIINPETSGLISDLNVQYICLDYKIKTAYAWINNVFGIAWANFSSMWVIVIMVITIFAAHKYPPKKPVARPPGSAGGPTSGAPRPPAAGPGAAGSAEAPRRPPATTQDSAATLVVRDGIMSAEKLAEEGLSKLMEHLG